MVLFARNCKAKRSGGCYAVFKPIQQGMDKTFLPIVKTAPGGELLQGLGRLDMQAVMAGILINARGLLCAVTKDHGVTQSCIGRGEGAAGQRAKFIDAATIIGIEKRAACADFAGFRKLLDLGRSSPELIEQGQLLRFGKVCLNVGGDQVGNAGRDTDKQVATGTALIATRSWGRVGEALAQKGGCLFQHGHCGPGGVGKRVCRIKGAVKLRSEITKHLLVTTGCLGGQGTGLGDVVRNPVYGVIKLRHQCQLLSFWYVGLACSVLVIVFLI